jgi:2-phosphoglycerate kinase
MRAYFIGGAARMGKTTAALELVKRRPMLAASADAIRRVAKSLVSPEANPRLHKELTRGAFGTEKHLALIRDDPEAALAAELAEAEETWKSVLDFLSYYRGDGQDAAVEGVAVLPKLLAELDFDFRAVFLVYTDDRVEALARHARDHPSDWLHEHDEATIRAWASFNQLANQYYATEAAKYGYPVVEVNPADFHSAIQRAMTILTTHSR